MDIIIGPASALRRAVGLGARPSLVGRLLGGSGVASPTSIASPHGSSLGGLLGRGGRVATEGAPSSTSTAAGPTSVGAVALRAAVAFEGIGLGKVEVPGVGAVVGRGQAGAGVGAGGSRLCELRLGWGIRGLGSLASGS